MIISWSNRNAHYCSPHSVIYHRPNVAAILAALPTLPQMVLKQIITPGATTDDGVIVAAVESVWFQIINLLKDDPDAAYSIPARVWEEMIAGFYDQAGFDDVTLTPRSGDGGRDVIAVKRGIVTVRVLDQVKAYSPGHLVTADEIRALIGVLHADQGATNGVVTTTSDFAPKVFTDKSIAPFLPARLRLVNGKELAERLQGVIEDGTELRQVDGGGNHTDSVCPGRDNAGTEV